MRKLVIISHTEHQLSDDGKIVGWGPTVRELNYLSQFWDEIVHVACLEKSPTRGSSLPYIYSNVRFVAIPKTGGNTFWKKWDLLVHMLPILWRVHKNIVDSTEVQLRLPMGPGFILIAYFATIQRKRKFKLWVKWATNWGVRPKSMNYIVQKWLLNINVLRTPVTINGSWESQPTHCYTFENPAIDQASLSQGLKFRNEKTFTKPYRFLFVGRVDVSKGVDIIIQSIKDWPLNLISDFTILGDGPLKKSFIEALVSKNINVLAPGFVPHDVVLTYCANNDFLLLPSKSEGFPKVIIEALNYGCFPICTPVGSIPYYLSDILGFHLMKGMDSSDLTEVMYKIWEEDPVEIVERLKEIDSFLGLFTLEAYFNKLRSVLKF